jgi:hypothetical protein
MAITTMRWQSASESLSSEILRSNHRNRPRQRFIRFQRFLSQQRGQFSCGHFSTETPKLANGNGHGADRTLYVSGSAGSNEHGEVGRQERGPGEDSLEKS